MKDGEATGRYRCQSYLSKGKAVCTSHTIYDAMLAQIVLNDIRHYACLTDDERIKIATALRDSRSGDERESGEKLHRRLQAIEHRLETIAVAFKKLYEDRVFGIIPDDMFRDMMSSYTSEKDQLQEDYEKISSELETHSDIEQDISTWFELVAKHEEISALERSTVLELIKSVEVQETFDTGGQRHSEPEFRKNYTIQEEFVIGLSQAWISLCFLVIGVSILLPSAVKTSFILFSSFIIEANEVPVSC